MMEGALSEVRGPLRQRFALPPPRVGEELVHRIPPKKMAPA
jgi:hypothetical protein